jgi:GTP cyclohydrolase III
LANANEVQGALKKIAAARSALEETPLPLPSLKAVKATVTEALEAAEIAISHAVAIATDAKDATQQTARELAKLRTALNMEGAQYDND